MQEIDHLRVRESRVLYLAAQNVHLVAGRLPKIRFPQIALEKLRIRQIAALKAASGQIDLGKQGAGDGGTAEIKLGKGHFGKSIVFDLAVCDLAERGPKPPGGLPYRMSLNHIRFYTACKFAVSFFLR